ncbi:MAG: methyltransferase domain-containing protein [Chloroflexota bacterium]
MTIDFGKTAQDYQAHRQGFPPAFFDHLTARNILAKQKRVLDIGTGTGTLARGAALGGCDVVGLDIAPELIEQARSLDAEVGVNVTYHVAPAEETGLADSAFDVVMAGQCWHWFDRPRAASEVQRLLKPNGYIVIAHLDWIPLPDNVVEATEALILKYNPAWSMGGGNGMYPAWLRDLAIANFQNIETFSFDLDLYYTHISWRGRIRASAGVAASLEPERVQAFDAELATLLADKFPTNPLPIHHRVWATIAQKAEV